MEFFPTFYKQKKSYFDIIFCNHLQKLYKELKEPMLPTTRHDYFHQNRKIYSWQESLESITIFIECPPLPEGIKKSSVFTVTITSKSLSVGIKGNPPYLSHEFKGIADSEESTWYLEFNKEKKIDEIVIEILKAQKGILWGCAFKGHEKLNPVEEEDLKKKLLLERFQEEHPGFDFSDAEVNGQVPDARTFMGGIK